MKKNFSCAASSYLTGGEKWKLHPDWVYCEYNYAGQSGRAFDSPETNMVHFLQRLDQVSSLEQISRIFGHRTGKNKRKNLSRTKIEQLILSFYVLAQVFLFPSKKK